MLITCPNCTTSYRIEPSSLGTAGRSVRCVRCRSIWFAAAPPEPSPAVDAAVVDWTAPLSADQTFAAAPGPAEPFQDQPPRSEAAAAAAGPADDEVSRWPPVAAAEPRLDAPPVDDNPAAAGTPATAAPDVRRTGATSVRNVLEDIESFAVRQLKRRKTDARRHWSVPVLPTVVMALLVANIILIGWRKDVVRILPQTASLYEAIGLPVNLRGLSFSNVTSMTETHDGVPVLVVEGTVKATSKRIVEVPRLRISLRNAGGQEVYAWTTLPGRSVLSPGETLAFRSRLASPPADGHDVIVRFFNRRDLVAGLQ